MGSIREVDYAYLALDDSFEQMVKNREKWLLQDF